MPPRARILGQTDDKRRRYCSQEDIREAIALNQQFYRAIIEDHWDDCTIGEVLKPAINDVPGHGSTSTFFALEKAEHGY